MADDFERRQDDDDADEERLDSQFSELNDEHDDEIQDHGTDDEFTSELDEDWGGGELEAAYMRALSALEASEAEISPPAAVTSAEESSLELSDVDAGADLSEEASAPIDSPDEHPQLDLPQVESDPDDLLAPEIVAAEVHDRIAEQSPSELTSSDSEAFGTATLPPTPRQIIEACLFVGGAALTSKKICGILRGEFDAEFVDREIDQLNRQYAAQRRPYEIRLGEGGYRLTLREEFERIRYKVYGLGPKEVRLSQDALEVLAVVAYHQPIKQARIEELGKPGCGAVLRQLVRRELIAVERDPAHPRDVSYKTTPRFLSLFDIRSLDELPRHEQVSYK